MLLPASFLIFEKCPENKQIPNFSNLRRIFSFFPKKDDEDEEDLRSSQHLPALSRSRSRRKRPTQSTYLVDHHPQMFDLEQPQPPTASAAASLTRKHVTSNNFATMPRHLPSLQNSSGGGLERGGMVTSASRTSTFSRTGGGGPQSQLPPPPRHYGDTEEMQRQAYIQSLGEYLS